MEDSDCEGDASVEYILGGVLSWSDILIVCRVYTRPISGWVRWCRRIVLMMVC